MGKYLTRKSRRNLKTKTRKFFGGNDDDDDIFGEDASNYVKDTLKSSKKTKTKIPKSLTADAESIIQNNASGEFGSTASYEPSEEIIEIKKKLISLREQRQEINDKILELDIILLLDDDNEEVVKNKEALEKRYDEFTKLMNKYKKDLQQIARAKEPGITEKLEEAKESNLKSIEKKLSNIENIEEIQKIRNTLKNAKELLDKQRKEILEMDPFVDANFDRFDKLFKY
jgi:hypothetical protein